MILCHRFKHYFLSIYKYNRILGVYCTYGTQLGLYPIGLVLGGTGAEMAVQCGRDNGSIPKKLGSEFVIRRNNDHVTAQVCRRGTELVNIDLKIGEYNNAMTGMLYQFPEAGKKMMVVWGPVTALMLSSAPGSAPYFRQTILQMQHMSSELHCP